MNDVRIRRATIADVPEMQRIRMSVVENRLSDPSRVQPSDTEAMLRDRGPGWIAEVEERIIGFAVGDLKAANVWALFVEPAAERIGAGRRLHDALLDSMFGSGLQRVWLSTDPGTRAERFYRRAGWLETGLTENGEVRFEMTRQRWEQRKGIGGESE